jgi:hypothetical protein
VDRRRRFFILIAVLGGLYVLSLGTGVWLNRGGEGGQPGDLDSVKDPWAARLGGFLSTFAPRLELAGLACNGQPVRSVFKLEGKGQGEVSCRLDFAGPVGSSDRGQAVVGRPGAGAAAPPCEGGCGGCDDDRYCKTDIRPLAFEGEVYVRARFDGTRFDREARDRARCFLIGPVPATPALPDALRLLVEYEAKEDGELRQPWECWLRQEPGAAVPLTVMEGGGTLTLRLQCADCGPDPECRRCDPSRPHAVRLKME